MTTETHRIAFRPVTRWHSGGLVHRVVNGVTLSGKPTVRFGGYRNFVVEPHWIEGHEGAETE